MVVAACPRCDGAVALYEGRPQVTAAGVVELWHRACWDARAIALPVAAIASAIPMPSRRPSSRVVGALVGGFGATAIVAIVLAQYAWLESAPPVAASLANVDAAPPVDAPAFRTIKTTREPVPAREAHVATALEARYPVPVAGARELPSMLLPVLAFADLKPAELGPLPGEDLRPLDEVFPTLRNWTHPVTNSPELMPELAARHFGAKRIGIMRAECGEGHCGIDLDGPRGRPVVSVAAGVVVRIERSELGIDGRSGRYVRVEHDDGTLTAYMHLDDIADRLNVGDHVSAGQYVGTLGATATFSSPPHLHFSLEVPNHPGRHGDNTDTHYVDPAPFLVRSTIDRGTAPERVATAKPAS